MQMVKKFQIVFERMKVHFAAIKLLSPEKNVTVDMMKLSARKSAATLGKQRASATNKIKKNDVNVQKIQNAHLVKDHAAIVTVGMWHCQINKCAR